MKKRYINSELMLETWKAGVEALLFPADLVEDLNPQAVLDQWADNLPSMREKLRADVDLLIDRIFEFETPEGLFSFLRKTDPRITALYFDRILAAGYSLDQVARKSRTVEIPQSWETLILMLLLQKPF